MVPNHLLDRIADFSLAEVRVLLFVSRHTHGFHETEVEIGRLRLAKRTGLHVETLSIAIGSLRERRELIVRAGLRGRGIYSIPSRADWSENPISEPGDCADNPIRSDRNFRPRIKKQVLKKEEDLKESAQQHHLLLKDMLGKEPSADDVECLRATLGKYPPHRGDGGAASGWDSRSREGNSPEKLPLFSGGNRKGGRDCPRDRTADGLHSPFTE